MSDKPNPRITQVMTRPTLSTTPVVGFANIIRMIDNGEEARRIFLAIAESAASIAGVKSVAIFLPQERATGQFEMVASIGDFQPEFEGQIQVDRTGRMILQSIVTQQHKTTSGDYNYFEIVCVGASIGILAVIAPGGIADDDSQKLSVLAHHTGVVFERSRLSSTLQHFLDRLEVLNELNQLIASNVGLQHIVKSLARESAFRFAADISLAFLLDEDKQYLSLRGGYGCSPNAIPKEIFLESGTLAQVMRVGGHLSITNLKNHANHGLDFIEALGIKAVDCCCLEVRGQALGAILIGFRRENIMSQHDLTRFEEFAQGAAVAIANAITQDRITAYSERLEELVASRTADLAIQTERAEEANRSKSQFLANMSHELRTPLTAIVGYASVLADGVFGQLTGKQGDALNAIVRSSDHLKNLIDDVLNLARIESGKETADPTRVGIKDVLSQTNKLMMQSSITKGIELKPVQMSAEAQNASLFVDTKHMHQIIINLMSNAVKYTPKGGSVQVSVELLTDMAKISITDTGVGIPPAKLKKLFERFERGEDTYSRNQEGTGIGLNLTRSLVELNGGRIGVDSVEGKGSTFWILMPLAGAQPAAQQASEPAITKSRLDGLSTVVVDDNRDTCEVLKQILVSAGANVRVAHTVKEGLALVRESKPDIILTDLAIPGESGLVLIEQIRNSSDSLSKLPILVLSACAFETDREAALSAGASAFIPKPFKPVEITHQVRQLTLSMAMESSERT